MVQSNDGGANVTVNGGQTWTVAGLPDRPVLQRVHHQARAVSRLRRAAGQLHRVRRQPGQPRRRRGQPAADLLRGRRRRERLHRARPERPERVLRRQLRRLPEPARSRNRPAARGEHLSEQPDGLFGDRHQGALPVDVPDRVLADRREDAVCLVAAPVAHHERRAELGEDQPEPDAIRPEDPAGLGRPDHQGPDRRRDLRGDLHHRAVAAGRQHHLDRLRRRLGARHARRRQDLGEGDAARSAGVHAHQPDRGVAASERRRLPGGEPVSARRSQAVRLQDHRLRQELDEDRHGHSRHRLPAHHPRRSKAQGPAVRRHRARDLSSRSTTAPPGSR